MSSPATKSTFALFFGNRGFFPASLMDSAREEMARVLKSLGHEVLIMDANATRHGAVETPLEGEKYAAFLKANEGKFDGVILSLPNFGDENGALAALKSVGVPIMIQAYPDDLDKMAPALRRDAFCGKLSITDVFFQSGVKFTSLKPHTVSPSSPKFAAQVDYFDRMCRTVSALKCLRVGSIGARVTPFKTVRIDEVALERHGITVESFDMSEVIGQVRAMSESDAAYRAKSAVFSVYTDFSAVPQESFSNLVKTAVAIDRIVEENELDTVAVRCWIELQKQLGISPCVILSEMNDRAVTAACEVDLGNAVMMHALSVASGDVAACLDWNNNYGDDEDKCILFHCGPIPQRMMRERGTVTSHSILDNAPGICSSWGCNTGDIRPMQFTFGSLLTDGGKLKLYLGEGEFIEERTPSDFFGCGGVAHIDGLQDVLMHIVKTGHRHHVSATPGHIMAPVREALEYYLGYEVTVPQARG